MNILSFVLFIFLVFPPLLFAQESEQLTLNQVLPVLQNQTNYLISQGSLSLPVVTNEIAKSFLKIHDDTAYIKILEIAKPIEKTVILLEDQAKCFSIICPQSPLNIFMTKKNDFYNLGKNQHCQDDSKVTESGLTTINLSSFFPPNHVKTIYCATDLKDDRFINYAILGPQVSVFQYESLDITSIFGFDRITSDARVTLLNEYVLRKNMAKLGSVARYPYGVSAVLNLMSLNAMTSSPKEMIVKIQKNGPQIVLEQVNSDDLLYLEVLDSENQELEFIYQDKVIWTFKKKESNKFFNNLSLTDLESEPSVLTVRIVNSKNDRRKKIKIKYFIHKQDEISQSVETISLKLLGEIQPEYERPNAQTQSSLNLLASSINKNLAAASNDLSKSIANLEMVLQRTNVKLEFTTEVKVKSFDYVLKKDYLDTRWFSLKGKADGVVEINGVSVPEGQLQKVVIDAFAGSTELATRYKPTYHANAMMQLDLFEPFYDEIYPDDHKWKYSNWTAEDVIKKITENLVNTSRIHFLCSYQAIFYRSSRKDCLAIFTKANNIDFDSPAGKNFFQSEGGFSTFPSDNFFAFDSKIDSLKDLLLYLQIWKKLSHEYELGKNFNFDEMVWPGNFVSIEKDSKGITKVHYVLDNGFYFTEQLELNLQFKTSTGQTNHETRRISFLSDFFDIQL